MESRRKDVFIGQTGPTIINMIKDDIYTIKAPANKANLYQTLDLTVTEFSKNTEFSFLKRKFAVWF